MSQSKEVIDFNNLSIAHVQEDPNIVYEIGDGVIPEMAEAFKFDLDAQANAKNMSELIRLVGPKATMRDNVRGVEMVLGDAIATTADWVDRAGIMTPDNGGLWLPDQPAPEDAKLVFMAGVPRWIKRSVDRALELPQTDVYAVLGGRDMDSPNETDDEVYEKFTADNGRVPKEYEYFRLVNADRFKAAGKNLIVMETDAESSADLLTQLFEKHPELLKHNVAAVRVATAARMMALQLRLAACAHLEGVGFDTQEYPQMYAISDTAELARTAEDAKKPAEFQSPVTAARMVPVTAKEFLSNV